ncbi:regulation of nuclear pre-mRNA domain-containing protein 1B isoform X1 [Lepisosteus oculatus]|uniref:regulation of nuclear pre-mRNA domain-containing protein 1B isoform X1 n=1 Tax=Lepisosteus oculatus TaxID=7918 RepID=UPI00074044CA|nr:PREDICTED: regulation of nuclear pre-mRNA domain-containing protein 1B isoform X1 [Lepisosteus oculatus]XP_015220109.1 PREDICTED: regulation of nuclear pre-mRNA domain-containing protein 1B isoform X1 [Lepisosteus oculatus]
MSSFSESALEKKLSELSNSQQSVQTLSLWIIHHRKHSPLIVRVWHREMKKAKSSRKLTFLYLANDVIQNSKRKGPEFTREFETVLVDACSHVAREADDGCKKHLERLLNIWQERSVYGADFIQQLKLAIEDSNSPKHKAQGKQAGARRAQQSQPGPLTAVQAVNSQRNQNRKKVEEVEERKATKRTYQKIQEEEEEEDDDYRGHYSPQDNDTAGPLLTEELIKALQDLENAASGDAAVRQKIASLPQEVQDVSLLEKITDKEAAEKLSKTVDEACLLLAEYNGRLAAELEDRRQLARMLTEYIHNQKDILTEREKKLEEYKQKLARVTQVRKELKSHIQSLPDLSLLPNVTGGLAPLPSAGDLFSTD